MNFKKIATKENAILYLLSTFFIYSKSFYLLQKDIRKI